MDILLNITSGVVCVVTEVGTYGEVLDSEWDQEYGSWDFDGHADFPKPEKGVNDS